MEENISDTESHELGATENHDYKAMLAAFGIIVKCLRSLPKEEQKRVLSATEIMLRTDEH